ncbi:MAG: bifunctional 4-hydroxy-3-methylbut-2-enyl diphosphate reductase/30S ribosomal protein S1 [Peptococcaceae bacterium]|nr:bifunctional 4-hydroxy-3-methylbut-2-enyl diphosphate reductase/30S ribosomal protein S1 [Peptococcaceae bacterium]
MEIKLATKAGFCFGVRRAIDLALKTAQESKGPIYSLGPLIHNPQVVNFLATQGITPIDDFSDITEGTLIIRSHGVQPQLIDAAKNKGLQIIDATCPFVKRAQRLACDLTAQGYQVVVVGDKEHPEVQGIVGWTNGQAIVVENPSEAAGLPVFSKVGVVAQTTQPEYNFDAVVQVLQDRMGEVTVSKTICNAVAERQKAALALACEVDVMIVVGGANSANTRKLTSLCKNTRTPTYAIETADQLDPSWFRNVKIAGLTAGASTPDWIIEEVESRMRELEEITSPEDEMQNMEVKTLRAGEIVKGVVVEVDQDEVLVDVGAKSEGVVPLRELSCCEVTSPHEIVKVGDEIDVWVVKAKDNEGRIILSKERADAVKAWETLQESYRQNETVSGIVREVVKGGLLVDVGVRAFLPASQVDRGFVEDLHQFVNQEIRAKIIEFNKSRKKIILSRKAVLEEEYAEKRQKTLASIQEGDVVKGVVRRLTEFGAFVDIGGLDGLLHISEISWHRINHPSEELTVGDEIDVKVLKVDKENEKVSLSRKQILPNPWDNVQEKYLVDSIVKAKVVRLVPFGAFVELEPGVEGLIHISHLADWHVAKPEDVVAEGQEIDVKVLSVDPEAKRIRLSLREAQKTVKSDDETSYQDRNSGKVTIGDVFGDLFDKN